MKLFSRRICIVFLLLSAAVNHACGAAKPQTAQWQDISEKIIQNLLDNGKKIGYPGKTAGIAVDRTTGDVFMIIPGQGIWKSTDQAQSFKRADKGEIGGRCETGFTLNFDPLGKRLACFMLDGSSAYTLDSGKTWQKMLQNQRGWDAGSVLWADETPKYIFALRHECGGEIYTSIDMGESWTLMGKAFASVGILDPETFVATKEKENGIFRSTDAGKTWTKISELQPAGRDIRIFKNRAYWTSEKGLLVSTDKGKTWTIQAAPVECSFGPYFGKNEKQIVVAGKKGFYRTDNAGKDWKLVAPLPPDYRAPMPGWFLNFGWDPNADILYASCMGKPAYKFQL
ncbi:MAG: hypothetical protein JW720_15290 [Sedimentisphaerales bacterium]|nr:hypothetical protein [Sedimentisphaerales bacterium]